MAHVAREPLRHRRPLPARTRAHELLEQMVRRAVGHHRLAGAEGLAPEEPHARGAGARGVREDLGDARVRQDLGAGLARRGGELRGYVGLGR